MRNIAIAFVAGFLATLGFHQPVLWLLNIAGVVQRAPFAMNPTWPFGVPAVVSLAFWGGVWGIVLWLVLRRLRRYWLTAIVFGAIAPTLVAAFVVGPLKGGMKGSPLTMLVVGLIVNAAWGFGTAVLLRAMRADRGSAVAGA